MTINRYAAAFLSFALVIVGALVSIPSGAFTWISGIQLGILGASTGVTLFVPLAPIAWAGILKTGLALAIAALQLVVPLLSGGVFDRITIGLFILGLLQAVASELGIQVRKTAALIDARDSNVVTSLLPGDVTAGEVDAAAVDSAALAVVSVPSPR